MAKTKTSTKSKTSIFLCCFGSNDSSTIKGSNYMPKEKRTSWFSWRRIRNKMKSTSKTVPFEASFSNVHQAYSKSRSKVSTLHKKSKTPPTNPPPLTQPSPPHPATPYYSPTQTRHGPNNNITEDTREQSRDTPPRPKRQERRLSLAMKNQTTTKNLKNARRNSYDPIIGMSVLVVTLVITIFFGRFCAIICTSAWLYFIPRFRNNVVVNEDDEDEDDDKMKSKNVVDLDSEEYKKKVIMEGLLGRNNRGTKR